MLNFVDSLPDLEGIALPCASAFIRDRRLQVSSAKKFVYDLWGDAVNTAGRMESHGVAGRIHVSAATADLVKNYFNLASRGKMDVKGKGQMETFLVHKD